VIGSGLRAHRLASQFTDQPALGYRVIGHIDERRLDGEAGACGPYLGGFDAIPNVLASTVVDEVVVALPMKSFYQQTAEVIRRCEEQGVRVSLPLNLFETRFAWPHVEVFDDVPLLRLGAHRMRGWRAAGKGLFDLAAAAAVLVALTPLFVVIATLIKVTSRGPVFFTQERVGLHKRPFRLVKFRTMVAGAEARQAELEALNEANGPVFKIRHDPRITPLGRWLRRTSIDELPQLINVIRGDMSLVGPRPLPLRDVQRFSEHQARRRFSVKPGITCFWQVSGRSGLTFDRWMELDMRYIDDWSFGLDLKLLLQTVPAVLRGRGAY
jgi:exopolysaccharide biosynthesis polyprenyl glycosylphosphotransferase